jgi:hypothetical protein
MLRGILNVSYREVILHTLIKPNKNCGYDKYSKLSCEVKYHYTHVGISLASPYNIGFNIAFNKD